MVYGIYSSAAGLLANQDRQEVLANNLANVNTAGFKQDLTVIRERQPASRENLVDTEWSDHTLAGLTGHVLVAPPRPLSSRTLETTGKLLDAAIAGKVSVRGRHGSLHPRRTLHAQP